MKVWAVVSILLMATVGLCGRWPKPIVVHKSVTPVLFLAQATDENRNKTYFIYTKEVLPKQFQLYFQCIDQDVPSIPVVLMSGSYHAVASDIVLTSDSILLALNVHRSGGLKDFVDVFFLESKDEGKTWSDPLPVPRPEVNDPINRFHPQLLVNEANTRVCIFYFRAAFADEAGNIAMTCRPPDSKIFSTEVAIIKDQVVGSRVRVVASVHNLRARLHMVYIGKDESGFMLYYQRSEDNGATWKGKKLRQLGSIGSYNEPALVTSPSNYKDGKLLLAYTYTGNGDSAFLYSYDSGETWTSSTLSGSEKYILTSVVLCKYKLGVWGAFHSRSTVVTERRIDNEGRFNFWWVQTSSVRELDNPFTSENRILTLYRPQMGCSYFPETGGIVAASGISYNPDGTYSVLYNRATGNPT